MSTEAYGDGDEEPSPTPACSQCRKKKQRCSREEPCRSCVISGALCVYEGNKRRGPRAGFIDALTTRMDTLEAIVLGQSLLLSSHLPGQPGPANSSSLTDTLDATRQNLLNLPRKRQRLSSERDVEPEPETTDSMSDLPPPDLLHTLCAIYFVEIHPWIPILHQSNFEKALASNDKPSRTILQAITAATIKFSNVDAERKAWYYKRCRDAVLLASMDLFSVETLQASIIVAYDTIGSGKGPRSWSIIASTTRVVEQLGLAVEEDVADNKLLNRIGFLTPPRSWTESEERRRIFWTVFLMDRFCSVTTGWNTSLTSTDVKRRLPVEGTFWRDHEQKATRYFNISQQFVDSVDESNALGGFAYHIEATECLKRVATFLLREEVDFSASDGLRRWFDVFQSLDTMLIRWKTFLPERWQSASVDNEGYMDPNLTLAHITHNTSVILLHQNIAYPDANYSIRLPRATAAQTCLAAASEISTIATKFLLHHKSSVSPPFTFCLFIAARALLAHSIHCRTSLDENFSGFISSLRDISGRWNARGPQNENLAGQFADRLETAMHANSISVRVAALEAGSSMSLASPPFPDIFENISATYDASNYNIDLATSLQDYDRIFTWADEPIL